MILNFYFLALGFEINAAKYPKKIAAAIPAAHDLIPPVNVPSQPSSSTAVSTPLASVYPKPESGTVAPELAKSTIGS